LNAWPFACLLGLAVWTNPSCNPEALVRWYSFFVVIGAAAACAIRMLLRHHGSVLSFAAYLLALSVLNHVDYSPVIPFRRLYRDLTPGMTEGDVFAALGREFPDGGRFKAPTNRAPRDANYLTLALSSDDPRFDAEIISVRLQEGLVVSRSYQSD
jgi:hypothetical protein